MIKQKMKNGREEIKQNKIIRNQNKQTTKNNKTNKNQKTKQNRQKRNKEENLRERRKM